MDTDEQVQRTMRLNSIFAGLNGIDPHDARYLLTLLEARAESTAAILGDASSLANTPARIQALTKDHSPLEACHALFELAPLLHRASYQVRRASQSEALTSVA